METKIKRPRDEFFQFPNPRPCPVCGKVFTPAVQHTYKIFKNPNYVKVCSYKCARAWEKKGGVAHGC